MIEERIKQAREIITEIVQRPGNERYTGDIDKELAAKGYSGLIEDIRDYLISEGYNEAAVLDELGLKRGPSYGREAQALRKEQRKMLRENKFLGDQLLMGCLKRAAKL